MTRRRFRGIAVGLALLALASVSVARGRTLHVVDMNGAPVPGVWVIYHHEGARPNPAHSTTYQATGRSLIQGDSAGRVEIPLSVHVHWPFPIETHPSLRVDLVYAPDLHNGLATIGDSAIARPGAVVADDLATVSLADLSSNPEGWEGTLMNVRSIIGDLISERTLRPARRNAGPETMALTRVLIGDFSHEYRGFLDRYGDVARPRPEMPRALRSSSTEVEQQAWEAMVERDLAREPLWGDRAERLFAREVERFVSESNSR
jgi:hypothetical protein